MKQRVLVAALLLAASFTLTSIAEAQQMPPGKWWRRDEVARQLELTSEQQNKLDEVFRGAANELIDARGDVEKLQIALRGELDRVQLRRQELQRLATQLTQARGKLFERELMMLADMRGILNDDQWNRLRTFLDRAQERMRPRNDGGNQQRPQQRPMPRRRP
jgi:Skp family chaperone for outer membrane proteins